MSMEIQYEHMPRKARIDAPGALHHIILRGIERKAIFKQDQDYQDFLKRILARKRILQEKLMRNMFQRVLPKDGVRSLSAEA